MNYKQYMLTFNDCYKRNQTIYVKGIMIHSTGANNKKVSRYASDKAWNRPGVEKCVHAFIGADEEWISAGIVQTLPWNMRAWHCGKGALGSANNTHIGIEICEDALNDEAYLKDCLYVAAHTCAYLCKKFKLNPALDGVIISHAEGYRRKIASNHGDIDHWLKKFGMTMDNFREMVYNIYVGKDEPTMTQEKFNEMAENWLKERAAREPSPWTKTIGLLEFVEETQLSSSTSGMQKFLTKEEILAMIKKALSLEKE